MRWNFFTAQGKKKPSHPIFFKNIGSRTLQNGGDDWDRTSDLLRARQALSQLSYTPIELSSKKY